MSFLSDLHDLMASDRWRGMDDTDKRNWTIHRLVTSPLWRGMDGAKRKNMLNMALEAAGLPTERPALPLETAPDPLSLENARIKVDDPAALITAPSEALRAGVDAVNDTGVRGVTDWLREVPALPGELAGAAIRKAGDTLPDIEQTARGVLGGAGSSLIGILNSASLGAYSQIPGMEDQQRFYETQADAGGAIPRMVGESLPAAAAATLGGAALGPEAAAFARGLPAAAKTGLGAMGFIAADELGKMGRQENPHTLPEALTNIGVGTLAGAGLGKVAGKAGELLRGATRPAPGSLQDMQAAAIARHAVSPETVPDGAQLLNLVQRRLGLGVVKGETFDDMRARAQRELWGRLVRRNITDDEWATLMGRRLASPPLGRAAGGNVPTVVPGEPGEPFSGQPLNPKDPFPAQPGDPFQPEQGSMSLTPLSGEKPPDYPINRPAMTGGNPELDPTIRKITERPDVLRRLEAVRHGDPTLLQESAERLGLGSVGIDDPESVARAALKNANAARLLAQHQRELEAKAATSGLDLTQKARATQQAQTIGWGLRRAQDLGKEYTRTLREVFGELNETSAKLATEVVDRAAIARFGGKVLKSLDTAGNAATIPPDASPKMIVEAMLEITHPKQPEVVEMGRRLLAHVDAHDPDAIEAAMRALHSAKTWKSDPKLFAKKVWHEFGDWYNVYWYTNILSGLGTHMRNFATNTALLAVHENERLLAAAMSKATGLGDMTPAQVLTSLSAAPTAVLRSAVSIAKMIGEESPPEFAHLLIGGTKWLDAAGPGIMNLVKRGYAMPGPGLLMVMDVGFKGLSCELQLAEGAARLAENRGASSMREIGEALPGIYREIAQGKHPELLKSALEHGRYMTLTDRPGAVTQRLIDFIAEHPVAHATMPHVVPFLSVPNRLLHLVTERIGIMSKEGPGRTLNRMLHATAENRTQAENDLMLSLAKRTTGSLLAVGAWLAAKHGKASGPYETFGTNPTAKRQMELDRLNGVPPSAVRVGDKWISTSGVDPLGSIFAPAAAVEKAWERYQQSRDDWQLFNDLGTIGMQMALDKASLKGLIDVSKAVSDQSYRPILRSLESQHLPWSSAAGTATRILEPTVPDVRAPSVVGSMTKQAQKIYPATRTQLPPRYDQFGRPIKMEGGAISRMIGSQTTGVAKNDPLVDLLKFADYIPPEISSVKRTSMGAKSKRYELPPEAVAVRAKYRRDAVATIKKNISMFRGLTQARLNVAMRRIFSTFDRQAARDIERLGLSPQEQVRALLEESQSGIFTGLPLQPQPDIPRSIGAN